MQLSTVYLKITTNLFKGVVSFLEEKAAEYPDRFQKDLVPIYQPTIQEMSAAMGNLGLGEGGAVVAPPAPPAPGGPRARGPRVRGRRKNHQKLTTKGSGGDVPRPVPAKAEDDEKMGDDGDVEMGGI